MSALHVDMRTHQGGVFCFYFVWYRVCYFVFVYGDWSALHARYARGNLEVDRKQENLSDVKQLPIDSRYPNERKDQK